MEPSKFHLRSTRKTSNDYNEEHKHGSKFLSNHKKMFIWYLNDKGKLTSAPYLFKRINTVNSFDFLHHPSTI